MNDGGVLTLVGMLAVVAGVLFLAYWATRWIATRGLGGRFPNIAKGGGTLKLLGQLPLGRGERLALVQCGAACFLLGVTERSIVLLRELTAEEATAWLSSEAHGPPPPGFWEALRKGLTKDSKDR